MIFAIGRVSSRHPGATIAELTRPYTHLRSSWSAGRIAESRGPSEDARAQLEDAYRQGEVMYRIVLHLSPRHSIRCPPARDIEGAVVRALERGRSCTITGYDCEIHVQGMGWVIEDEAPGEAFTPLETLRRP